METGLKRLRKRNQRVGKDGKTRAKITNLQNARSTERALHTRFADHAFLHQL